MADFYVEREKRLVLPKQFLRVMFSCLQESPVIFHRTM